MTAETATTSCHLNATEEAVSSSASNDYGAFGNGTGSNEGSERGINDTANNPTREYHVWRKPWITALVIFFLFYVLWFKGVIIQRYWMDEDYGKALPGLGKTALRKTTIRMHMTFGGIAILCSPIQMITPFTSAWKKRGVNWYRKIHRFSGRVYIACAILSFFFGQWFICLKEFALVGGYNMGVAFSLAGVAIAYFAYMTWISAPNKNNDGGKYTVQDHRNYAIRSFSQIIAPILYRYWYILVSIFTTYETPPLYMNGGKMKNGSKLICNDQDVCDDYKRPFDAFYCWFYWLSAWAVAELIIVCLPKHQSRRTMPTSVDDEQLQAPLLAGRENTEGNTTSDDVNARSSNEEVTSSSITGDKNQKRKIVVDFVGCLLVVLTLLVTGPIVYIMVFKREKM